MARKPLTDATPSNDLAQYRKDLIIDKDDLDECLIRQPELYYHVAEAHSQLVAERDATKMDLEVAEAEEAQKLRDRAETMDEKLTEGGLKEKLTLVPRLQQLRRKQLEQKAGIDSWQALKDSFQQRSYMLRELVPMHLSRLGGGSVSSPRTQMADTHRRLQGEERRRRAGTADA